MATVTLTIPDAVLIRVITALCATNNSTPTAANAKQILIAYIMTVVRNYESQQAAASALKIAAQDVDSQITIS